MERNFVDKKYRCPCCGYYTLDLTPGYYDICEVCFWEDDPSQRRNIDEWGGANHPSLRRARAFYRRYGACAERFKGDVRKPGKEEIIFIMKKSSGRFVRIKTDSGEKLYVNVEEVTKEQSGEANDNTKVISLLAVDNQRKKYLLHDTQIKDIQILNRNGYSPYYDAHVYSSYHKQELGKDKVCGCFSCLKIFSPAEIVEWVPEVKDGPEVTALCPHCGIDSVIGESSGYPITHEFLKGMQKLWELWETEI